MKIGIIGAGASGMVAAIAASEDPRNQVLLFEAHPQISMIPEIFAVLIGKATQFCFVYQLDGQIIVTGFFSSFKFLHLPLNARQAMLGTDSQCTGHLAGIGILDLEFRNARMNSILEGDMHSSHRNNSS